MTEWVYSAFGNPEKVFEAASSSLDKYLYAGSSDQTAKVLCVSQILKTFSETFPANVAVRLEASLQKVSIELLYGFIS